MRYGLVIRAGVLFGLVTAIAVTACTDQEESTAPKEPGVTGISSIKQLAASIRCAGDVRTATLACDRLDDTGGPLAPQFLIVGGQNEFVRLTSSAVDYNRGRQEFSFDVTVQNLIPQALGTSDGTTVTGVSVFFLALPAVTSGTGAIGVQNPTGTGTFTGSSQPYYLYDEILQENETSGVLQWILDVPKTVDTFSFEVLVSAQVPYPNGFVRVTSAPAAVTVGNDVALTAEAVDALGLAVSGRSFTWSTPDPSIATVSASGGVVSGVTGGVLDIVASSDGPEADGAGRVTVIDPDSYDIELRFLTGTSAAQRSAFESAAARWETLITGDLTDIPFNPGPNNCHPDVDEWVDDLLIFASVVDIDGPGGILGQAGPCYIRNSDTLTVSGIMEFDVADLEQLETDGQLDLVILHEMGHIIGLGTLWEPKGLVTGGTPALSCAQSSDPDPRYVGTSGIAAYTSLGGTDPTVPLANTGGAGTRCGHWRESVFDNELMTGYLNPGANPLSVLTVQSFDDVGYSVDPAGADPYTLPGAAPAPAAVMGARRLVDDIRRGPIFVVDERGRIRVYRGPQP